MQVAVSETRYSSKPPVPEKEPISLIIADASPVYMAGLHDEITRYSDLQCTGTVTTLHALLEQIPRIQPDVILLDESLTQKNPEKLELINDAAPESGILVGSEHLTRTYALDLIRWGARGLVSRHIKPHILPSLIRDVGEGLCAYPKFVVPWLAQELELKRHCRYCWGRENLPKFTPNELKMLNMVAVGSSTEAIAAELHVCANTVKNALSRIRTRLGILGADQLRTYCISIGLPDSD